MTNKEWLFSLSLDELFEWFDAEHVDTVDDNEKKIVELTLALDVERKWGEIYRSRFSDCADRANEIYEIAMLPLDEGMA